MHTLTITYLNHSGFMAAVGDVLVIMDYYPGDQRDPGMPGVLDDRSLDHYEQVVFFASHGHADHFDPAIYQWARDSRVSYVLGYDIPQPHLGTRLAPGEKAVLGQVSAEAYGSTDAGVSFLIEVGGYTLFHAGDLNLWHWREESTIHEIERAERDFYTAVRPLEGRDIDVAFFPVDPRQGNLYDAGANYFVMAVKPHVLIPMHWQGRSDVALEYARKTRTRRVDVIALVNRGEGITLKKAQETPVEPAYGAPLESVAPDMQEREAFPAKKDSDQDGQEALPTQEDTGHEEPDTAL